MYNIIKLKNGLNVILVPLKDSKSVTILKSYKVGSLDENNEVLGVSHYLEHMMFKGTKKRKNALDISKELDAVGGHYNAFTGKTITSYYVQLASSQFELACDVLSDMLYNSVFDSKEVNKERGVILEEMKMHQDAPAQYVDDIFEQEAYKGHPLGKDIIGTKKSLNNISRKNLVSHVHKYYTESNSVLVVVGKISKDVKKILNKYFNKTSKSSKLNSDKSKYNKVLNSTRIKLYDKKVGQAHMKIGFRCKGSSDEDISVYSIITTILGGGMSSKLFTEVREKRSLAYYVNMYPDLYEEVGNLVIGAGVNSSKIDKAIKIILSVVKDFKTQGVTDKELLDAKNNIIGSIAISMENSSWLADSYSKKYLISGKVISPDDVIKNIKKVTKNDIMRVSKELFNDNNITFTMISNNTKKKDVKPLLKI